MRGLQHAEPTWASINIGCFLCLGAAGSTATWAPIGKCAAPLDKWNEA